MKLRSLSSALLACALAMACSSGDSPNDDGGADDAQADAPLVKDGAANDAAPSDAAPKSDASPIDASPDGGLPQANPPPGATLCKQGTLAPADVVSACKQPVSFGPPPIDACAEAASNGGKYEVWCGATTTYVWVEIDALRPVDSACPVGAGHFVLSLSANYSFSTGNGAGAGPSTLTSTGNYPYALGTSRSFILEATLPTSSLHGSFTIWAMGTDSSCPQEASTLGALVAGVSEGW